MACNCSLVQNSINPQQISKQSRTLPSFYYHIKYSWCKLKRNVSQMPILILLSFKILVTLTLAFNKANARNTRSRPKASRPRPRPENLASRPRPRPRPNNPALPLYKAVWHGGTTIHKVPNLYKLLPVTA